MGRLRETWRQPWVPYAVSAAIQLALAPWFVHDWDGFVFLRSAQQLLHGVTPYAISEQAPGYIFLNAEWPSPNSWFAYPPGALALFAPSVGLATLAGLGHDAAVLRLALKVPLIAGNLLLAYVAGLAAARMGGNRRRAEMLLLFNPFLIFIGAVWGMFDAWMMLLLVLSALLLAGRRPVAAGLAFGAATLMKIFPLFVAPLFFAYAWRTRERKRDAWTFAGAAAGAFALVSLPFFLAHPRGYYAQVLGIHLARPIQGFAAVNLPYLPRFFASHFGFAPWPLPPGWVGPALSTALLAPGLLLLLIESTTRPADLRNLLRSTLHVLLWFLLVGKVVNEQYFVMPVALLTILSAARADRWALRAWTAGGLVAALTLGFHFLTFMPRGVALRLVGATPEEAIYGIGVWAQATLHIPFPTYVALTDVVSTLAVVPAFALALAAVAPPLARGVRSLARLAAPLAPHPAPIAAASLVVVLLFAGPVAWGAVAGREVAAAEAPMPPLPPRVAGATYYLWWNDPGHDPDAPDGNWVQARTTPADGYYTTNGHRMELDIDAMRAAGLDFAAVAYHGYDDSRYLVFSQVARAKGLHFAALVDADALLGNAALRATGDPGALRPTDAAADALRDLAERALRVGGSDAYLRVDGARALFVQGARVGPSWDAESERILAQAVLARHNGSFADVSAAWGAPIATLDDIVARYPADAAGFERGDWATALQDRQDHLVDRVRSASGVPLWLAMTGNATRTAPVAGTRVAPNATIGDEATSVLGNGTVLLARSWNQHLDGTAIEPTREHGTGRVEALRAEVLRFRIARV